MTDPITTPAQMREAAIYYMDCEFDGHSGPLISLALVRDDGYSTHIRVNIDANDPWVQANVMPIMDNHGADIALTVDPGCVGQAIRDFIGPSEHPLIIADSPVDIGRFCAAISTASDGQWSSVDYPKISFAVHNVVCYPTKLAGAVQHNAWWDAWVLRDTLRALYDEVKRLRAEARQWCGHTYTVDGRAALVMAFETAARQWREIYCLASPGSDEEFHAILSGFDTAVGMFRAALKGDSDE